MVKVTSDTDLDPQWAERHDESNQDMNGNQVVVDEDVRVRVEESRRAKPFPLRRVVLLTIDLQTFSCRSEHVGLQVLKTRCSWRVCFDMLPGILVASPIRLHRAFAALDQRACTIQCAHSLSLDLLFKSVYDQSRTRAT